MKRTYEALAGKKISLTYRHPRKTKSPFARARLSRAGKVIFNFLFDEITFNDKFHELVVFLQL